MTELTNKKILVTGGTGFIGSAIVNELISQDINVNIISHPEDSTWRINNISKCKIHKTDLRVFSQVEKLIAKIQPDLIFHLAGIINQKTDFNSILEVFSINFDITKNLILALNDYEYDLFINTGSGNEYGDIMSPFKETDREEPNSPYSAAKVAATHFCSMISYVYDKPIISIRPFLVYGPKQILRALIPSLIYSGIENKTLLLTSCEQTRDFIFIDDVVNVYISLAKNVKKVENMGIFNVGTGKEFKILTAVNLVKRKFRNAKFLIGEKEYRHGESMQSICSIEKINKTIGWLPKFSLEEGINATIEWWQNNRKIWIKYKNIWD